MLIISLYFFFFNDTATTEIYTLSLHDALPICRGRPSPHALPPDVAGERVHAQLPGGAGETADRKSTRLNSSHLVISYAVFCLKKKKQNYTIYRSENITSSVVCAVQSYTTHRSS